MKHSRRAAALYRKLGCGLGRRDETPNVAVGQEMAARKDAPGVAALVELLADPSADSDAVKALYECGYQAPDLLIPHAEVFLDLLAHKKNRLVWGGMIALMCIAPHAPDALWKRHREILDAFESGTVITQDAALRALAALARSSPARKRTLSAFLLQALQSCRDKDLARRYEVIAPALVRSDLAEARKDAASRVGALNRTAQRKLEKLLDA